MNGTSSESDLQARLQKRAEQDRRFAILPASTPENPLGIMDGRPTVRLSSK